MASPAAAIPLVMASLISVSPIKRAAEKQAGFAGNPDLLPGSVSDQAAVIQGGIHQIGPSLMGLKRYLARGHHHQIVILHKELVGLGIEITDRRDCRRAWP